MVEKVHGSTLLECDCVGGFVQRTNGCELPEIAEGWLPS